MKFCGTIGYAKTENTRGNIWEEITEEVNAVGDVINRTVRWVSDSDLNDDLTVQNQISVAGLPFLMEDNTRVRYVIWQNTKWKVTSIQIKGHRLILTLGGIYNE